MTKEKQQLIDARILSKIKKKNLTLIHTMHNVSVYTAKHQKEKRSVFPTLFPQIKDFKSTYSLGNNGRWLHSVHCAAFSMATGT